MNGAGAGGLGLKAGNTQTPPLLSSRFSASRTLLPVDDYSTRARDAAPPLEHFWQRSSMHILGSEHAKEALHYWYYL